MSLSEFIMLIDTTEFKCRFIFVFFLSFFLSLFLPQGSVYRFNFKIWSVLKMLLIQVY